MKAGWEIKPLGSLCTVVAGQSPDGAAYNTHGAGLPFYQGKKEFTDRILGPPTTWTTQVTKLAEANDILMSVRAPVGPINLASERICIGRGLAAIRPSEAVLTDYLWYALLWMQPVIKGSEGAVFASINRAQIEALSIPVPPLEEQKRIVAVLDETFEGLDRARANAEANLADARNAFVEFRETYFQAKLCSGWNLMQLTDLLSIKHGYAFKSEYFVDQGDLAVLTPGNFHEHGGFRARGGKQKYYAGEFPSEFLLNVGDVLVAMTEQAPGLLGSCLIVPDDGRYLHNQRLGLLRPLDGVKWDARFISQAFNLAGFRKGLSDTCSGATVRHTSPGRILAQKIPYCDRVEELEGAALEIDQAEKLSLELAETYNQKAQDIQHLRQSLLQKAFSGELT